MSTKTFGAFLWHATRLLGKQQDNTNRTRGGAATNPQFFWRRASLFVGKMEADALAQPFDMLSIDSAVVPDPMADDSMPREAEDLVFVDETPVRDNAEEEDQMPVDGESNNGDSNPSSSARGGGPARFMIRHIHGAASANPPAITALVSLLT